MAKSIKNINKVLKKFKKFGDEAKKMVEQTTESNAKEIAADAKVRAPKDMGAAGLSGSIFTRKNTPMNYSIIANAKWAPYVEFGTGKQVDLTYLVKAGIPKSYAMQFKGKGIKELLITWLLIQIRFPAMIQEYLQTEVRITMY